jgi:hypothetical protein
MVMFREAGVFFFRPYRRPGRENGQGEERTIQPAIESWLFRKGGPVFLSGITAVRQAHHWIFATRLRFVKAVNALTA